MRSLDATKITILACMLVVLGVPFLFRPPSATGGKADRRVIIITPHNEQIRTEFGRAFSEWHEREYGETAEVVWVTPGGTSEIRRQLQSVYSKAISSGQLAPDGSLRDPDAPMPQDLLFGGGTYEHGKMKSGVTVSFSPDAEPVMALAKPAIESVLGPLTEDEASWVLYCIAGDCLRGTAGPDADPLEGSSREELVEAINRHVADTSSGRVRLELRRLEENGKQKDAEGIITMSISVPVTAWSDSELRALFGPNHVGPEKNHIYDPEKYWLGTATSGFGIVYNRDILKKLGVEEPDEWSDFGNPKLRSWVALADPRQSGSVATLYDSILNNLEWDEGWRVLREMSANARYFSNSSPKVPLDVSQGQAAIGVAIDFYGRYQAQAVMKDDETPETSRVGYVDPEGQVFIDPDPITLLRGGPDPEMAQRFIRFVLSDEGQALWQFPARGEDAPPSDPDDPSTWGPRRFELRRMPVRRDFVDAHIDRFIDTVDPFALAAKTTNRGWRSSLSPMMATFGIETHHELVKAWEALSKARADDGFPKGTLAEMERLFYAMPTHVFPDGTALEFNEENYRAVRNAWRDPREERKALLAYRAFFKDNYERVVELGRNPEAALADRSP